MEKNKDKQLKNKDKILENTLDYYTESMSFKFVNNLLNKTTLDCKENKKQEINKRYNVEQEIAAVDDYEDMEEKYLKRRYKYEDENEDEEDNEIVYGFEKKCRKNDNIRKAIRNDYNNEDYEENINYSKYNQRKEQTIGDRIRQQRQIKNQDHNLYNNNLRMANNLEQNLIENRNLNRFYENRNYDFVKNNNSISSIKNLTIVISVIFLLVLSFLVYKINILSKDIDLQDSAIVKFRGKEYNLETLVYENEKFSNKINKLEKEISSLQNEVQSAFVSKVGPNSSITTTNNKQDVNIKTQESTKIEKNIQDTKKINNKENIYSKLEEEFIDDYEGDELLFEDENYTVKEGDTLSYISQKFYGSKNKINKIKEANNLKSDDLKVGQKIKIPDK